jgi:hypothetical protein
MGWEIKYSENGYQITSTVTGELIHEKKWMSKDETKAFMAEVALYNFFEELIKIDKDFLYDYRVNDKLIFNDCEHGSKTALSWMIDNDDKVEGRDILNKLLAIKIAPVPD